MSNMPITTNSAQATVASKQTASAPDNGDVQNSPPFGDVLARQIGGPVKKDAKTEDKLAADALAQLGAGTTALKKDTSDVKVTDTKKSSTDSKKADPTATDGSASMSADMLAALLPQAVINGAASNASSGSQASKSDNMAITSSATDGKRGGIAPKTDIVATIQTKGTEQATAVTSQDAKSRDTSFAATLTNQAKESSGAVALHVPVRETAPAPSGPQANAAALAALQNTAASIAAPILQPVQMTINTPVNQDKWSDEFGQKITWLASSNKDQTAELHLNPPQLGPLDVVLKVSGDQATALFTSPHAAVRDAIEQAMPRLRDMMADNGIMLGNATVSDQAPRDQGQTRSDAQRTSISGGNEIQPASSSGNGAVRVSPISRHNGIVDTFA